MAVVNLFSTSIRSDETAEKSGGNREGEEFIHGVR